MARKQVAHKVMVTIVRRCLRCQGTGRIVSDKDARLRKECPDCHGMGDSNDEIPLDDLVAMVVSSLGLDVRLVQKVGER